MKAVASATSAGLASRILRIFSNSSSDMLGLLRSLSRFDRLFLRRADLRFLQGYLESVGQESEAMSLDEPDLQLSDLAACKAKDLARVGDEIEEALGGKG